ncbi:o-succinylbenzoate--CoA ligase [Alicyclobacillus acidiphilus]|uniref:o-succinylbenzoate--CoA ligase n=1 Tax=Alicyclobacillus acidiphilus TaxID=182455 RepID=UPI000833BC1C|nr:o-succinylbenzoate--CoA ligase [Alicyclobacillus acidiphilus]
MLTTESNFAIALPDWLQSQANRRPHQQAIVSPDGAMTYDELMHAASNCAASLYDRGIRAGHRVAVAAKSSLLHTLALHALIQLGAVIVPLNWRLSPEELAFQLGDSQARALMYDDGARELADRIIKAFGRDIGAIAIDEHRRSQTTALASGPLASAPWRRESIQLSETHAIVYTSGTTGRPKGAMITYGNHWFSAMASVLQLGFDLEERWLVPMPLFHVGGMGVLMRSLIYGTTVVAHNGFDVERVNRALDEDGITIASLVPAMLSRLLEHREVPYPKTLRSILLGGSAAPRGLLERALTLGVPVNQSYGMTETNTQVVTLMSHDALRKLGSSGKPLANVSIAIADKDGVPTTEPDIEGEILVRGPSVIAGYLNRPDANEQAFRGGWFHTGDIGRLDDEGYLYVLDRRSDLIVSGGENIYPAEVESAIGKLEAVVEAAVVARDDDTWGQVPVAFVVIRGDRPLDLDALKMSWTKQLRERLAHYKVPKAFFIVDELPRNASGKLLRRELRELVKR